MLCRPVLCCRLRFDFSNNGAVDVPKLAAIESICRDWVTKALPVSAKEVSLAEAKAIKGLRAVFGEVRTHVAFVVSALYRVECFLGRSFLVSGEHEL